MSDTNKITHDLAPNGHLLSLLWAWYREYGRRTEAYERRTIVLAAGVDPKKIDALTAQLNSTSDNLKEAVEANQPQPSTEGE